MYRMDLVLTGLCAACILLGMIVGLFLARWMIRRVRPAQPEGPAPCDLGYDPTNPMNAGRGRETVQEGGATWYVIRGRQ